MGQALTTFISSPMPVSMQFVTQSQGCPSTPHVYVSDTADDGSFYLLLKLKFKTTVLN